MSACYKCHRIVTKKDNTRRHDAFGPHDNANTRKRICMPYIRKKPRAYLTRVDKNVCGII